MKTESENQSDKSQAAPCNIDGVRASYFNDEIQANFKSDFGFSSPHKTTSKCTNPVFANKNLHRIAIMKVEHFGSKGDRDENGISGWVTKRICTGCGKEFMKHQRAFYTD